LAEASGEKAIWELNYGDISSWDLDEEAGLWILTISDFETSGGNIIGDIEISVEDPEGLPGDSFPLVYE